MGSRAKLSKVVLSLVLAGAPASVVLDNSGDRHGACEVIRWWIKDGGRDCRMTKGQKNGGYEYLLSSIFILTANHQSA